MDKENEIKDFLDKNKEFLILSFIFKNSKDYKLNEKVGVYLKDNKCISLNGKGSGTHWYCKKDFDIKLFYKEFDIFIGSSDTYANVYFSKCTHLEERALTNNLKVEDTLSCNSNSDDILHVLTGHSVHDTDKTKATTITTIGLEPNRNLDWKQLHKWSVEFRKEHHLTISEFLFYITGSTNVYPMFRSCLSFNGDSKFVSNEQGTTGYKLRKILNEAYQKEKSNGYSTSRLIINDILYNLLILQEKLKENHNIDVIIFKKDHCYSIDTIEPLKDDKFQKIKKSISELDENFKELVYKPSSFFYTNGDVEDVTSLRSFPLDNNNQQPDSNYKLPDGTPLLDSNGQKIIKSSGYSQASYITSLTEAYEQ